jgi:UPF0716 protein FxsA
MLPPLILLFTLLPALEFYLLFKIGSIIGPFETFMIIIFTGVFGAFLAKTQGLSIFFETRTKIANGQIPAKQLVHGFLVFGGGLLLLTPGFLTDIIGFSMVLPGTRHIICAWLSLMIQKGIASGVIKFASFKSAGAGFSAGTGPGPNLREQMRTNTEESLDNVINADFKRKE